MPGLAWQRDRHRPTAHGPHVAARLV